VLVRERMSRQLHTLRANTPVEQALRQMREKNIHHIPVVDEAGKLVGIVSEGDLLNVSPMSAVPLSNHEMRYLLSRLCVADVMTRDVITVTEDTPVEDAAQIMNDRKIGGLPVVRQGQLVGIITETDLFRLFPELLGVRERGVRMTMLIPERKGMLAEITAEVARLGGNIVALGMFQGQDPAANRLVTIKVADVPQDKLLAALKPLVIEIIDSREV